MKQLYTGEYVVSEREWSDLGIRIALLAGLAGTIGILVGLFL